MKPLLARIAGLLLPPLLAIVIALSLGAIAILAAGRNPLDIYAQIFAGALLTPFGLGQTIAKATPLVLTGLSVALAARAGLFNIGGEGQMIAGAWAMAMAGIAFGDRSAWLALPLTLACGAAGGASWAAVPAWLKARRGSSEVILTILANWLAVYFFGWLLRRHVDAHPSLAETSHTLDVGAGARLPLLADWFPDAHLGRQASAAALIALVLAVAVGWLIARTRSGFAVRAVGLGADAARAGGIDVARVQMLTLLAAGALAGLAGAGSVLGAKGYFEEGLSAGAGFTGIAVAFLGRGRAIGVVLAAVLLGALAHGGLIVNALVPKEIVDVIVALLIAAVAAAAEVLTRIAARRVAPRASGVAAEVAA